VDDRCDGFNTPINPLLVEDDEDVMEDWDGGGCDNNNGRPDD
jgi:hypothetical protein